MVFVVAVGFYTVVVVGQMCQVSPSCCFLSETCFVS
jgi:hypothetical protein